MSKLLALSIFGTDAESSTGAAKETVINYQEIAFSILLKFIDVIEAAIIIVAGLFVIKIVKRYLLSFETTHENQKMALNLFEKITSGFLLVITVTLALKVIGLDLTLLISVLTLGLSFGLRDVIKNYVAGLLILFKSPFEIGDIVKIRNFTGKIEKIEFQSITIKTFDHKQITIHNKDLLTQPITNFSKRQFARLEVVVSLGYGSDIQRALNIFDKIIRSSDLILKKPKYSILFKKFGQNSMDVLVRFWVQRPCNILRIKSQIAMEMQEAFDEDKLFAPYAREAGLTGEYGMTEARRERLKAFYGQPAFADIAGQTLAKVATAVTGQAGAGTPVSAASPAGAGASAVVSATVMPAEEYDDADEPE